MVNRGINLSPNSMHHVHREESEREREKKEQNRKKTMEESDMTQMNEWMANE